MGSIIVRPGSGDEGDPTFIPELSSEQKIPAEVWFTWMVIYVVAATVFTIWFGIRGIKLRLQPIAAREPRFVIAGSIISILWTSLLCMQRAFDEQFPCWLTLWSGVGGGVLILNVYLLRAIFLYSNFNLTQEAIEARKKYTKTAENNASRPKALTVNTDDEDSEHHLSVQDRRVTHAHSLSVLPSSANSSGTIGVSSSSVGTTDSSSNSSKPKERDVPRGPLRLRAKEFFKRNHRFLISKRFLIPVQVLLVCAVLGRATHVTIVSEEVQHHLGDGCPLAWQGSATALASYSGICACLFTLVGFGLRGRLDAFWIKKELKWVGLSAVPTCIAWYVLNNVKAIADWNKQSSLSTIFLLLIVTVAFVAGILFPLYRSYYDPPELNIEVPEKVSELIGKCEELLKSEPARLAFGKYLASEFAVQHLYFWEDIDRLSASVERCKALRIEDGTEHTRRRYLRIIKMVRELFVLYIVEEAEQMVNIGRTLQRPIVELHDQIEEKGSVYLNVDDIDAALPNLDEIVRLYVIAQRDVFKMLRNSHRRFKRSGQYKTLVEDLELKERQFELIQTKMLGNSAVLTQTSTLTRSNTDLANDEKAGAKTKAKRQPSRLPTLSASRASEK